MPTVFAPFDLLLLVLGSCRTVLDLSLSFIKSLVKTSEKTKSEPEPQEQTVNPINHLED